MSARRMVHQRLPATSRQTPTSPAVETSPGAPVDCTKPAQTGEPDALSKIVEPHHTATNAVVPLGWATVVRPASGERRTNRPASSVPRTLMRPASSEYISKASPRANHRSPRTSPKPSCTTAYALSQTPIRRGSVRSGATSSSHTNASSATAAGQ